MNDITGMRFGRLVAIEYVGVLKRDANNKVIHYWKCICDCGKEKNVRYDSLIHGRSKSCGCFRHGADLTGKKFGRFTVLKEAEPQKRKDGKGTKKMWLCQCKCGTIKVVSQDQLVSGHTRSCGCYKKELASLLNADSSHNTIKYKRLYKIWRGIKDRCNNPNDQHHANYHDKGVTICKEWSDSFDCFKEWAFKNGYREDLTIDRIDPCGNYEPSNCRWATVLQQARNKRNTRRFLIHGKEYCVGEIEEEFGIKPVTFIARVERYGFTPEQAVDIPVRSGRRYSRLK